ncbi:FMN-binding negative transcriptional regulator [Micromonospora sp. CPCC 205371]|nr:FMN-binding negative transcriptional regulator [Micromonospora sp. CPCC 205371]
MNGDITDPQQLRALVDAHPWATLATWSPPDGLVVSHLPVIVDPATPGPVVLGHLGRADAARHRLGSTESVLIVQGPHGYISPTFYAGGPYVPTWNFVVVHLHGQPQPLSGAETYDILDRTVDRLERDRPTPWRLANVAAYAARIAGQTAGFRLVPDRIRGRAKLSQDKPHEDQRQVIQALSEDPVHANPALAAAMRHQPGGT